MSAPRPLDGCEFVRPRRARAARCLALFQARMTETVRRDLLKRHLAAHKSPSGTAKPSLGRTLRDVPNRVLQACTTCAANHLRCSEQKPCRRCTERDIPCVWNNAEGIANPATTESPAPVQLDPLEHARQGTSTIDGDPSEDAAGVSSPRPLDNFEPRGDLSVQASSGSPQSALGMRRCHPTGSKHSNYVV